MKHLDVEEKHPETKVSLAVGANSEGNLIHVDKTQ